MDQATECAPLADITEPPTTLPLMVSISKWFKKLYYVLTIHMPRPLPRTLQEFMDLKSVLVDCYGLEDRPDVWFTVAGQISSTEATKVKKSYACYRNVGLRLETNRLVRDAKIYFNNLNEERIKELTENIIASPQPESNPPPAA